MKGRLFSAIMLVVVLVMVLALPASAGGPGTITVKHWNGPVPGQVWTPGLSGVSWHFDKTATVPGTLYWVVGAVVFDANGNPSYFPPIVEQSQPVLALKDNNVSVSQMVNPWSGPLSFTVSAVDSSGNACTSSYYQGVYAYDANGKELAPVYENYPSLCLTQIVGQ